MASSGRPYCDLIVTMMASGDSSPVAHLLFVWKLQTKLNLTLHHTSIATDLPISESQLDKMYNTTQNLVNSVYIF